LHIILSVWNKMWFILFIKFIATS